MSKFILILAVSILTSVSQANSSAYVMMDGSVASCSSAEDVGGRAYRLSLTTEIDTMTLLTIESLVCKKEDSKISWAWMDIGEELPYNYNGRIVKKKITESKLQITDFEGTQVLEMIPLDMNFSVQTVILSDKVMSQKTVALVLQNVTEVSLKGQIIDTDHSHTGVFVLKLK